MDAGQRVGCLGAGRHRARGHRGHRDPPEIEAEWPLRLHPWPDLGAVACVVNTHLHFDHCGGNLRFPGLPIFVQRAEYEAVAAPDYVVDWVHFPGARYELVEGDAELRPGISVLSTPGHSPGHQAVVVATDEGPVVLAGDVTYSREELSAKGPRTSTGSARSGRGAST